MKSAFTMIELIFVIVIIGVLSAIAIPKISATRDDANIISIVRDISVCVNEIVAYATSQGKIENNLTSMSQSLRQLIFQNKATVVNGSKVNIKMNTISDCIIIEKVTENNKTILYLRDGNANGDQICLSLQNKIDNNKFPIIISGKIIVD